MIAVIDYGMGNLRSVTKALELYTDRVTIARSPDEIDHAEALILPGDGAFAQAMENLETGGWIDPLKKHVSAGRYLMGICLGFQLLFTSSEEFGDTKGLNIIPGQVVRFREGITVPHMGWNEVSIVKDSPFIKGIPDHYFYFIHSYYPVVEDDSWVIGTAEYDVNFCCITGKENIFATQFHPEKSHRAGLKIIENFVNAVESQ